MTKNYGDLITAGSLALALTVGAFEYLFDPDRTPRPLAGPIISLHVLVASFGLASFYYDKSTVLSLATCLGFILLILALNVCNFQQYSNSSLLPEFMWVYCHISANFGLSFRIKASLGILTLAAGLFSVAHSALPVDPSVNLVLFGCTGIHIAFHYFASNGRIDLLTMHGARAVMATTFAYHIWSELQNLRNNLEHDAHAGTFELLKACFFAVVGLASVGAFSSNIDEKKNLEDELRMVGLAAQASETAIAITDADLRIVWSNPALERLVCKKDKRDLHICSIIDALDLHANDTVLLEGAFEVNSAREVEINIGYSIYNVEVTPFPPATTKAGTFSVALRDITEIRRREHAEQSAEREVMMTKAMSKSMEVLTHELRTPLQVRRGGVATVF